MSPLYLHIGIRSVNGESNVPLVLAKGLENDLPGPSNKPAEGSNRVILHKGNHDNSPTHHKDEGGREPRSAPYADKDNNKQHNSARI